MKCKDNIFAVLLAGGRGTRLWPLSSGKSAKTFIRFGKNRNLVNQSVLRLKSAVSRKNILLVTDRAKAKAAKSNVKGILPKNVIIEPFPRNTAGAIGLAAIHLKDDDIMLTFSTDQCIKKEENFRKTILNAADFVKSRPSALVCIGTAPTSASTSFGYIDSAGKKIREGGYKVRRFIEKPDSIRAELFFKRPGYLWNAGIFVFKVKAFLDSARTYAPLLYKNLMMIKKDRKNIDRAYKRIKDISIDYQILEKSRDLYCVKGNFEWRDIGNWNSLEVFYKKDRLGNINIGRNLLINVRDSIIYNGSGRKIAVMDTKGAIIADTKEGLLICDRRNAEAVKNITESIKKKI